MFCARLAVFISAFLFAFANAKHTKHQFRRGDAGLSVINPTSPLVMCQVTTFRWNGTNAPYSVGILVGKASDAPLYHLGIATSNAYSWNVSLPEDTTITLAVKSSSGSVAYSAKLQIVAGTANTCLTGWRPPTNSSANVTWPTVTYANGTAATATRNTSGIGAAGAATSTPTTTSRSGAGRLTAGLGLLFACSLLALVA